MARGSDVSCWVIVLNSTAGCESESTATTVMSVFATKEKAELYLPILKKKVMWENYYQGEFDIEEVPFEPCG